MVETWHIWQGQMQTTCEIGAQDGTILGGQRLRGIQPTFINASSNYLHVFAFAPRQHSIKPLLVLLT